MLAFEAVDVVVGGMIVLTNITFEVGFGEVVAVTGPSGSGKSTLIAAAAGLLEPTTGGVSVGGDSMWPGSATHRSSLRLHRIGMVMQFAELLPELTILENVLLPTLLRRQRDVAAATALLRRLGIDHLAERRPGEVSGGERQRAAIARSLIGTPSLLLADEPTGALDAARTATVVDDLIATVRSSGVGALLCTHDRAVADRCDREIVLRDGTAVPT